MQMECSVLSVQCLDFCCARILMTEHCALSTDD